MGAIDVIEGDNQILTWIQKLLGTVIYVKEEIRILGLVL